ncbi:MAG TPA: Gldg family protein [Candidatus Krumholzibacteria bacterium]|nr:Gldg family protein [Candidatus Krumholzibacteria bacterium]
MSPARIIAFAGLALLALGAIFAAAGGGPAHIVMILLVAGVTAIVLAALQSGHDLRSILRGRAAKRGADSAISIVLLTAVLVVIQATSIRHSLQVDLTRNQRHTLSPQTLTLLSTLDRDVLATAFVRQTSITRAGVTELLDLYSHHSTRFRYRLVDPDRQPDLAERLHAAPDEIVVEAGDRRSLAHNPGEESLTTALIHVTRSELKAVYFVTGHGEKDINNDQRDGYSALRADLERQGYAPRPLSLIGGAAVPSDAAVVVIAGPHDDYLQDEVDALDAYARAGGSLFVMLDPRVDAPHLAALLAEYSLSVLNAVILDEKELHAGDRTFDATVVKVRRYERHPINKAFNYVTMFPRARPVFIARDSTLIGVSAQFLALSDASSWGETDMKAFDEGRGVKDGVDIAGPLPVAASATRSPFGRADMKKSRVVLVGDSDFVNNVFFGVLGNSDWFQNALAFLADDESMITIRPRPALSDQIYLSERQGRLVFLVCIILLPAISLGAGIAVIMRRAKL